ncbi:hypothetical protein [uncultured Ruegeria sp.]|uniref:hypothetical protein n=1 Tax=uncultured Ruegeria sp. TaxID=259304 RepID=UPI002638DFC8|nr:hypothetical protein [uncultured Ruegeria sp.]
MAFDKYPLSGIICLAEHLAQTGCHVTLAPSVPSFASGKLKQLPETLRQQKHTRVDLNFVLLGSYNIP